MVKKLLVKKQEEFLPELTQEIPASGIVTVGSDQAATLPLPSARVAPEQFVMMCEESKITLLCRVDGTEINGRLLPQGALHNLQLKDVIVVGDYVLILETAENAEILLSGGVPSENKGDEAASEAHSRNGNAAPLKTGKRADLAGVDRGRSLNDVLEGLRSEEKFYFRVEDAGEEKRRFYVETEEMWLGWAISGECVISGDPHEIAAPRAQIRKDWSGVVLCPLRPENVWLNDEALSEPRRLKNDDRMVLSAKETSKPDGGTIVKFHEPTALLVLDSILPKELPPPVLIGSRRGAAEITDSGRNASAEINLHGGQTAFPPVKITEKSLVFGYFTLIETLVMAAGTLVAAAIIFLILEWY